MVQLKYPGPDLIWEGGPASFSRFLGRFLTEKRSTMQVFTNLQIYIKLLFYWYTQLFTETMLDYAQDYEVK